VALQLSTFATKSGKSGLEMLVMRLSQFDHFTAIAGAAPFYGRISREWRVAEIILFVP
jgi:hypothetical protein